MNMTNNTNTAFIEALVDIFRAASPATVKRMKESMREYDVARGLIDPSTIPDSEIGHALISDAGEDRCIRLAALLMFP